VSISRTAFIAAALSGVLLSVTAVMSAQAAQPSATPGHDPQMVQALADSLGVSDQAALRRLDRESGQQQKLDELRKGGVSTDGAFFDRDGSLVVNAGDAAAMTEISAAGLTAREAKHGEAALNRIKSTLDSAADRRTPDGVSSWEADLALDTVIVRVHDKNNPSARAFLEQAQQHGTSVRVVNSAAPPELTQSVLPGSRMIVGSSGKCSVGFGARHWSGRQFLLSAGHCIGKGTTLSYNGSRFAKGYHTRFHKGRTSVDMGIAELDPGASIVPAVRTWGQMEGSIAVKGSQRASVGASICKSGASSGWTCGSVKAYGVTVTYTDRNGGKTVVKGLARSSVCAQPGDSGGAYISGNQAQGMTSGAPRGQECPTSSGYSYFQPLDDTLAYYRLTLNTY
jgi:hypothetical protein